jgi:Flp pilus assembly pilin Flp
MKKSPGDRDTRMANVVYSVFPTPRRRGATTLMSRVFGGIRRLWKRDAGATMAEYALLLTLIAVGLMIAIIGFRNEISNSFSGSTARIQNANNQATGS